MAPRKAGGRTARRKFSDLEVKNLWALSQLFMLDHAGPQGENGEEYYVALDPRPDAGGPHEVGPHLFDGVQRIVHSGIAWPVKSVSSAGMVTHVGSANYGLCVVVFKVDDATMARTDGGRHLIVLEEAGREYEFYDKQTAVGLCDFARAFTADKVVYTGGVLKLLFRPMPGKDICRIGGSLFRDVLQVRYRGRQWAVSGHIGAGTGTGEHEGLALAEFTVEPPQTVPYTRELVLVEPEGKEHKCYPVR